MDVLMKVRRTQEWDVPALPEFLKSAAGDCGKSVAQICREAEISTAFWYQVLKGNKDSISFDTLSKLCIALGKSLTDAGVTKTDV